MKIHSQIPFIAFQGQVKHSIISTIANETKIIADFLLFPDVCIVSCFYLFVYYLNIYNLKFSIYFKIPPSPSSSLHNPQVVLSGIDGAYGGESSMMEYSEVAFPRKEGAISGRRGWRRQEETQPGAGVRGGELG